MHPSIAPNTQQRWPHLPSPPKKSATQRAVPMNPALPKEDGRNVIKDQTLIRQDTSYSLPVEMPFTAHFPLVHFIRFIHSFFLPRLSLFSFTCDCCPMQAQCCCRSFDPLWFGWVLLRVDFSSVVDLRPSSGCMQDRERLQQLFFFDLLGASLCCNCRLNSRGASEKKSASSPIASVVFCFFFLPSFQKERGGGKKKSKNRRETTTYF